MVTKRQIERLKSKFPFKSGGVYVFDEVEGKLFNDKGREVSKKEVKRLSERDNVVVIIDDIGG